VEAERRQAEQLVRESEQRFRLVANTAPVMIWMSNPDKKCSYVNQPWLDFTGRSIATELDSGWAEGVHPQDVADCLNTYSEAFDRREPVKLHYRLRRHDGEYRWVFDIGVPRYNPDGSFAGYIGSCMDVTEQKLAEEALAGIGRKLIEAHEEERIWIARELHDDINQRLALVALQLNRRTQHAAPAGNEFRDAIECALRSIEDIARDVQSLSHRLHSSKLEYLGLAVAAAGFCRELSEQKKVDIEFNHADVPSALPHDLALGLFRVLQEALQNAVKHSGARHFKAELLGTSGDIQLTVSDLGVGFDQQEAANSSGLGLISMRERVRLVNGEFSIESMPGCGTTITVRVPLRAEQARAAAAAG
jgi:PAS domain S-box-containing protein